MSDNKEQCRAEFEFWYSDEGAHPKSIEKDVRGNYLLLGAAGAFQAWEAGWERRAAQPVVLSDEHPFFQLFLCALGALALHDQKNAEEYGAKARAILAAKEQA
jgi:hypothetical protein